MKNYKGKITLDEHMTKTRFLRERNAELEEFHAAIVEIVENSVGTPAIGYRVQKLVIKLQKDEK